MCNEKCYVHVFVTPLVLLYVFEYSFQVNALRHAENRNTIFFHTFCRFKFMFNNLLLSITDPHRSNFAS